jgi:hypothetical protein
MSINNVCNRCSQVYVRQLAQHFVGGGGGCDGDDGRWCRRLCRSNKRCNGGSSFRGSNRRRGNGGGNGCRSKKRLRGGSRRGLTRPQLGRSGRFEGGTRVGGEGCDGGNFCDGNNCRGVSGGGGGGGDSERSVGDSRDDSDSCRGMGGGGGGRDSGVGRGGDSGVGRGGDGGQDHAEKLVAVRRGWEARKHHLFKQLASRAAQHNLNAFFLHAQPAEHCQHRVRREHPDGSLQLAPTS